MSIQLDKYPYDKMVFFDGHCNLCNSSVDYLIDKDKARKLKYGSLQGKTASKLIPHLTQDLDTFVFVLNGKVLLRSTAGIRVFSELGSWRKIALIFLIVPGFIRDWIYSYVSKNRYKWFGRRESCRLATKEEMELFLD